MIPNTPHIKDARRVAGNLATPKSTAAAHAAAYDDDLVSPASKSPPAPTPAQPRSIDQQQACPPLSVTPETDAAVETIGLYRGDELEIVDPDFARQLEVSMRKLHAAYKQKVQGEMQLGHHDKGALALLAEIQREHPSLA